MAAAENNTRLGLARSMASAGARAYNGGLGAEPPAGVGQGQRWGSGGQSPLKLMAFWYWNTHFSALPEAFYTLVSYSLCNRIVILGWASPGRFAN